MGMSLTNHANNQLCFGTVSTEGSGPTIHFRSVGLSITGLSFEPVVGELSSFEDGIFCDSQLSSQFLDREWPVLLLLVTNFAEKLKVVGLCLSPCTAGNDVIHGHQDQARFMGGVEIEMWRVAPGGFQTEENSSVTTAHAFFLSPQEGHALTGHLHSVELATDRVSPVNLLVASSVVACPLFNELVWLNNIGQHVFKGLCPKDFDSPVGQCHD